MKLSPKAKRWRDHDDDVDKLNRKIDQLETTIREKQHEIDTLRPSSHSIFDR